jgi:ribosomal protein S27AE
MQMQIKIPMPMATEHCSKRRSTGGVKPGVPLTKHHAQIRQTIRKRSRHSCPMCCEAVVMADSGALRRQDCVREFTWVWIFSPGDKVNQNENDYEAHAAEYAAEKLSNISAKLDKIVRLLRG